MRVARGLIALEQQIHSARVGKLGRLAEAAMLLVEKMERGFNDCANGARIEIAASAVRYFCLRDCFFQGTRGIVHLRTAIPERFSNAEQDALEPRAAHGVFRRKIRAAEKWFSIGREERGERPAALPG